MDFETVIYATPAPGVARVTLNRPDQRNAQNLQLLYDLTAAFDCAAQDDGIKVLILAAAGPHFSSGHDLKRTGKTELGVDFAARGEWGGFTSSGAEGHYAREHEIYLTLTRRWRDMAKPTIAQVHGACIAGGLMLAWACDIIVASEDAVFHDPTLQFGSIGVEYFAHPWELGPRKAKELLFTADSWTADEAQKMGMVNRILPRADLESFVLKMALKIAKKPAFSLALAKQAVNRAVDIMGQAAAIDSAFGLHQLAHAHCKLEFGSLMDPRGADGAVKNRPPGV
jgi:enoyl-CoA hydratase